MIPKNRTSPSSGLGRRMALRVLLTTLLFCFSSAVMAQESSTASSDASQPTPKLVDCHYHGSVEYCMDENGNEIPVSTKTPTAGAPEETDTHTEEEHHGEEEAGHDDDEHAGETPEEHAAHSGESSSGENCHFHAGVEHCGDDAEADAEFNAATDCVLRDREYNRPLRIGALFIVLATSSIAVFGPISLARFTRIKLTSLPFTVIKQFGTGVIIATAYIHLLTHAALMFDNPCVGTLKYEATTTAIAMAGIFLAFLVEYLGDRFLQTRVGKQVPTHSEDGTGAAAASALHKTEGSNTSAEDVAAPNAAPQPVVTAFPAHHHGHCHGGHSHGLVTDDRLSVLVMEAGIIFHSILIGITLVVAGDSAFTTLLIVIIFHQMFEGLALGTRISLLPAKTVSVLTKLLMGGAFAAITPIGMAIGIGVLNKFNGNDRDTIIALGTLDALSAGILAWVGLVEMLAGDWVFPGGEMKTSGLVKTLVGAASLVAGMALMGLLGKWA